MLDALISAVIQSIFLSLFKAGVHLKAVLTSMNMAFVPISRWRFQQRQIPLFKTLTNVLRFCLSFWVILGIG